MALKVYKVIPGEARRRMCPCCCGEGKSDLSQWQSLYAEDAEITKQDKYLKFSWVCDRTGKKWHDEYVDAMTSESRSAAMGYVIMKEAAKDIDDELE